MYIFSDGTSNPGLRLNTEYRRTDRSVHAVEPVAFSSRWGVVTRCIVVCVLLAGDWSKIRGCQGRRAKKTLHVRHCHSTYISELDPAPACNPIYSGCIRISAGITYKARKGKGIDSLPGIHLKSVLGSRAGKFVRRGCVSNLQ